MNLIKYFDRFQQLHSLIRRNATGSPAELSKKLGLSKRAVFEYIRLMREMGAPIAFCHLRKTYYYERSVIFNMGFLELNNEETKSIEGGKFQIATEFFTKLLPLQK